MIDALTTKVYKLMHAEYPLSSILESRRASEFELLMADGRVARIVVEFDRVQSVEERAAWEREEAERS